MVRILKEIENQRASRAGAAFSSVAFTDKDNFIYRVTIEPGWGGTLTKVEVDPLGVGGELKEIMEALQASWWKRERTARSCGGFSSKP